LPDAAYLAKEICHMLWHCTRFNCHNLSIQYFCPSSHSTGFLPGRVETQDVFRQAFIITGIAAWLEAGVGLVPSSGNRIRLQHYFWPSGRA
jgi:hypothetical protein